ncbi:hypothetical protein ACFY4C_22475 [Actinomadura viridis]|uniref:hypothetical protein n=1 Tax=Actinomadura viridis TaxID=58110 RepID=UPI0036CD1F9F
MGLWSVVRWVRAAAFSATCAGLASAGHAFGGGTAHPLALVAGFLVLLGPALALTGCERSLTTILPAVGVSQVALHVLLTQTSPDHDMDAAPTLTVLADGVPVQVHQHGSSGLVMVMMHAVAVLVTAWWLECGEAALCAVVRCVAAWAWRSSFWLRPVVVHGPARVRPVWWLRRTVPAQVLRHVVAQRGPPARAVALL